jgi:hypothetical protein
VDPNSQGGIGDGDGRKEMRWIGTPVDNGVGAVVTAVRAVAAESNDQDGGAPIAPRCGWGRNPIMKSRNPLRISI